MLLSATYHTEKVGNMRREDIDTLSVPFRWRAPTPGPFEALRRAPSERPFVIGQLGQSLDGRIATVSGESRYISGAAALDHLHRLRAEVDAVVVGACTITADDPQLNVRRVPGRPPARVVIDPRGRISSGKWLAKDGARRLLVSAADRAPQGAELVRLPAREGRIAPCDIVSALFALGLRKILIEGGAATLGAFIAAGRLDRLHLLVAPVLIGSGRPGFDLHPEPSLDLALRPKTEAYPLGDGEILFDCDFSACGRQTTAETGFSRNSSRSDAG
jgi:diaminohydroxyphosphoribosylaminopyrimidine deaminase / 5-amino-6-(5-phosphoribosylamino)uracil reductase